LTAEFNWSTIDFVFPNQSPSLFLVPIKKRPVNWPLGNPDFVWQDSRRDLQGRASRRCLDLPRRRAWADRGLKPAWL